MPMISTAAAQESTVATTGEWYLVQCKPRQDERAEENLIRQGYGCSRPTCRRERTLRGQMHYAEESLFPGYLFIHMPEGANWAPLRSTRGVARVVAFGGRPLAVGHELIMQLQSRASTHIIAKFNPGVYGPDTWWTHVRGHGGHIMPRSQVCSRRTFLESDGRSRRQRVHLFQGWAVLRCAAQPSPWRC